MLSLGIELHIEKILDRELSRSTSGIEINGTSSSLSLALLLSQSTSPLIWNAPQLIIVSTSDEVSKLEDDLRFFNPSLEVYTLPAFDVSPYSGLYPNPRISGNRVHFMHRAAHSHRQQIYISSVQALMQTTIPKEVLKQSSFSFKLNDEIPKDFHKLLSSLGYQSVPVVEDESSFSVRGGIIDIFSPAHPHPVRLELFGDQIESMRYFDAASGRSLSTDSALNFIELIPAREVIYKDDLRMTAANNYRVDSNQRGVDPHEKEIIQQSIVQSQVFPGMEFLSPHFYKDFYSPLNHFSLKPNIWFIEKLSLQQFSDQFFETLNSEYKSSDKHPICPKPSELYNHFEKIDFNFVNRRFYLNHLNVSEFTSDNQLSKLDPVQQISWSTQNLGFLQKLHTTQQSNEAPQETAKKVLLWREEGQRVLVISHTQAQAKRLELIFEKLDAPTTLLQQDSYAFSDYLIEQDHNSKLVHILVGTINESLRFADEKLIILQDEDFFGKKQRKKEIKNANTIIEKAGQLSFTDLKIGDKIVHVQHGIGIYEGLKIMSISGVDSEFIQLSYKEGDKLYLPIYRINQITRYGGPGGESLLDKLGGTGWQKTKVKVKNHLREIAAELLELYAKRAQLHRTAFKENPSEFSQFESSFPYDETEDQLKAISDINKDLSSERPMDRLVCGDVGFGKTEIAIRAAFRAVQAQKQVAVLTPTTVLSFQHFESFQKRMKNWPIQIKALNRFVPSAESKKILQDTKESKVDILIGTHRILSKDVQFKDLGLLIIDEEHKFGVTHKEKIKKLKASVDTLTLSATPIPRTLNMSLNGIRDLSIINTPPVDRLPTRTFVTKFDDETIRKAILAELSRSGQMFFLHNRVQSIYQMADKLREIAPEARVRVGHGQMPEHELEQTMIAFFNHDIDILLCTTIIESGIDNPRANTMFIDNAHQLGLAQLYQLRGRVGRSKERAYCYLLIPPNKQLDKDAQERLKVIQENTALGSGIRIAHHDLELRGAGNLLSEEQSGHIDAVGYEMYTELLNEAIRTAKGEEVVEVLEPEINVRIPALIPNDYISDIRIRLSYYKALSQIESPQDIDRIEEELRDQFGKLPEQVINLMGLMLIRSQCKHLGIRDISSGLKTISLSFTDRTPLPPEQVIALTSRDNKKYSITPDMRLIVRMNQINWTNIHDELTYLEKLVI